MIEPVFERLSKQKSSHHGRQGVVCAKVDIDVGLGRRLAAQWDIRATPTFYFFLDGDKVSLHSHCHCHCLGGDGMLGPVLES